jgi:hypothetical protein
VAAGATGPSDASDNANTRSSWVSACPHLWQ